MIRNNAKLIAVRADIGGCFFIEKCKLRARYFYECSKRVSIIFSQLGLCNGIFPKSDT